MSRTHLTVYAVIAGLLAFLAVFKSAPLSFILAVAVMVIAFDLTIGRGYRKDP